ncbi:BZZ1 [Candida oxycetoniae]|uniref:Protein BZZ1 n=1 Tax=Candida oxycetoniae TaxID=497107 RepID=A0AAI9STH1_9ASCO|nr:BZZ1 [Candida oxycetoniae]KAI3402508.2 BZZ1 [Candida oxycetoniae]
MSLEELSIGNELKDSFKVTDTWIKNGINFLGDIDEFYRERSALEKEYSTKLKDLTKRYFDRKAKISSNLSVGDEPQVTPGSLESASLVLWNDVLTQTEAIAEEKYKFSLELQSKISGNLVNLRSKCDRIQHQIASINEFLVDEKKRVEDDVSKSKKHYDALCQATETARDKNQKSPSDKHQRKLEEKQVEMNNGKNSYLIKINVANRLKDKYYYQDVPEVLDYLQELNEDRVALLNKLLTNAGIIERNSLDRVKEKLHVIDKTIDQNNPKLDVAMFIKHNALNWAEPQDFYFIPCSFWHDDESLVIKEPELTELRRRLQIASNEYSKLEQSCLDIKQTLEESTTQRKQDDKDKITLKFDSHLQNSLRILSQFMKEDTNRVKNEVEIEIIQNFAGDQDLRYVAPAVQKKSRFGFLKGGKKSSHTNGSGGNTGDVVDNSDVHSLRTSHTSTSLNSNLFNLRKLKSNATTGSKSGTSTGTVARALYEYVPTSADETKLTIGDEINVVEEDDGSGWTLVNGAQGQGLVPTSYIEIISRQQPITTTTPTKKSAPPTVAPKRGAKRIQYVEALYDYVADGDDELTIHAGDRIILIQDDSEGNGWTEGELNGEKGMFPTSYVKKI